MEGLGQDIRFGLRMLVKNPAITIVAVLTLGLGVGANTAIFSTMNAFLLRPLPVQNPERLICIAPQQQGSAAYTQLSYLDLQDLRAQAKSFSDVLGYTISMIGFDVDGKADPILVSYVSGNTFSALGLKPAAGRLIYGEQSDQPGSEPVIVLGYSYWKKKFNADPSAIGKQVKLNGRSATIVGVTPEGFQGLYAVTDIQAYMPLGMQTIEIGFDGFWTRRDLRSLLVFGVLNPGVSLKQAQSSVDVVAQRLAQQYPDADKGMTMHLFPERMARPQPGSADGLITVGAFFMILAGLVLLLACTNVANILLVRGTARQREMALRAALGAARTRLMRQLMTESMLLGLLGGLSGLLLGMWACNLLGSVRLESLFPIHFDFSFDWRVFAFGMAAALGTGIIVGFVPAWRASRNDLNSVLHEGSRGVLAGTARSRLRSILVAGQVAGSLMLLVVAGLFLRSAQNAERLYLGFDPSHLVNIGTDPHTVGMDRARAQQFYRQWRDRARALPGVQSVSLAYSVPMGFYSNNLPVYVEGRPQNSTHEPADITYNTVDPDYFSTLRIPMIGGRAFTGQDDQPNAPLVAIVNDTMSKQLWPNENPIGKHFSVKGPAGPFLEVVGIVKTTKYNNPREAPAPYFYIPQAQDEFTTLRVLQVRTAGSPEALIPVLEQQIHELSPELPIFTAQTMERSLQGGNGLFLYHMATNVTAILGVLGLILAVVGVYGVISYVASQRTHEIGVRMALGAKRGDVLRMVLRQGLTLVGAGLLAGLLLTFAAARGISSLLVGVSPTDPLTLTLVSLLLATVGIVSSLIPACRAMKVEPLAALKYE